MGYIVTKSRIPMVFDTLPAIKMQYGYADLPNIYTMAQMYALADDLAVCVRIFEKRPSETEETILVLAGTEDNMLSLSISKDGCYLCEAKDTAPYVGENDGLSGLDIEVTKKFAGEDEQGYYWGVSVLIPQNSLKKAGIDVNEGSVFKALLLRKNEEKIIAASASDISDKIDSRAFVPVTVN